MSIIKIYHGKKWTLQFLDALYNSIDSLYDPNTPLVGCLIEFSRILINLNHVGIGPLQ
jgi:hypothetical protein